MRSTGILLLVVVGIISGCASGPAEAPTEKPNIVVLFADDLGYGDLGAFGHPTLQTPHLDQMAREGMKLTSFYSAASVCTPSRAALLTGRLPVRSGMASSQRRVLFPNSSGGLPQREVTLAETLKEEGYATAAVGKWHLGHLPEHLPTRHGFDSYFGIPYSNDMDRTDKGPDGWKPPFEDPKISYWNVPLLRNEEVIERPAQQQTITRRYTREAVQFIEENQEEPFFLYLAHSFPHVPLFASEKFKNKSARGLYGDVVEELDWSTGQILKTLKEKGLSENTLVIFTSDNGPWLTFQEQGGSAGLLREGKGSTWEGGMREPAIAWWPGTIKAGSVSDALASTMDIFPTAAGLAGAKLPDDRVVDGQDLMPVLTGQREKGRDHIFYYRGEELFAVRKGAWKAHFITQTGYRGGREEHNPPLLFHLGHDPSEQYNVAKQHPEVIAELEALVEQHKAGRKPVKDQLVGKIAQE